MRFIKDNWPLFVVSGLLLLSTGFLGAMGTEALRINEMKEEIVSLKCEIEQMNKERNELLQELRRLRNGNKTKNESHSEQMDDPQKFEKHPEKP